MASRRPSSRIPTFQSTPPQSPRQASGPSSSSKPLPGKCVSNVAAHLQKTPSPQPGKLTRAKTISKIPLPSSLKKPKSAAPEAVIKTPEDILPSPDPKPSQNEVAPLAEIILSPEETIAPSQDIIAPTPTEEIMSTPEETIAPTEEIIPASEEEIISSFEVEVAIIPSKETISSSEEPIAPTEVIIPASDEVTLPSISLPEVTIPPSEATLAPFEDLISLEEDFSFQPFTADEKIVLIEEAVEAGIMEEEPGSAVEATSSFEDLKPSPNQFHVPAIEENENYLVEGDYEYAGEKFCAEIFDTAAAVKTVMEEFDQYVLKNEEKLKAEEEAIKEIAALPEIKPTPQVSAEALESEKEEEVEVETGNECETDYSFYHDDDEDDGEEAAPEYSMEEEEIFSAEVNSKIGVISNNRRTKTIFSMDVPIERARVTTGPGENGDGHEVGGSYAIKSNKSEPVAVANSFSLKNVQQSNEDEDSVESESSQVEYIVPVEAQEEVKLEEDESYSCLEEEKCPRLMAKKDCLIILPKAHSAVKFPSFLGFHDFEDEEEEAGISASFFNLILMRGDTNRKGRRYKEIIEIENKTSEPHGFKIFMNTPALSHIDVHPARGLIQPGEKVFVGFSTKKGLQPDIKKAAELYKIELNVFRCFYTDTENFEKFYKELKAERPDLISKQPVQRVILWDIADINSSMDALDSIEDEYEKRNLKEDIYTSTAQLEPEEGGEEYHTFAEAEVEATPTESVASDLCSMKSQLIVTEENLKNVAYHLVSIQQAQRAIFFTMIVICFIFIAFPVIEHFNKDGTPGQNEMQLEEPEEDSGYFGDWTTWIYNWMN